MIWLWKQEPEEKKISIWPGRLYSNNQKAEMSNINAQNCINSLLRAKQFTEKSQRTAEAGDEVMMMKNEQS